MKFWEELSTPWHSKRCRRRTTWIRIILKCTACSPRTGTSFRANLASIHVETVELCACQKVPIDRQTDRQTAFCLYVVDIVDMQINLSGEDFWLDCNILPIMLTLCLMLSVTYLC